MLYKKTSFRKLVQYFETKVKTYTIIYLAYLSNQKQVFRQHPFPESIFLTQTQFFELF